MGFMETTASPSRARKPGKPKLIDTHYRLPEKLYQRLRRRAFKDECSQADVVARAVAAYLDGDG